MKAVIENLRAEIQDALADCNRKVERILEKWAARLVMEPDAKPNTLPETRTDTESFIDTKEALRLTSIKSRSTLWAMEQTGDFPRRVQLSKNRIGWKRSDIERWITQRSTAPRGPYDQ